jgi:hypothetical protein
MVDLDREDVAAFVSVVKRAYIPMAAMTPSVSKTLAGARGDRGVRGLSRRAERRRRGSGAGAGGGLVGGAHR